MIRTYSQSCFFSCIICYTQHIILDIKIYRFQYPKNIRNLLLVTEFLIWSRKAQKHKVSNFQDGVNLLMLVNKTIFTDQLKTLEPFVVTFVSIQGHYRLDSIVGEQNGKTSRKCRYFPLDIYHRSLVPALLQLESCLYKRRYQCQWES